MHRHWIGLITVALVITCRETVAATPPVFPWAQAAVIVNSGSTNTQGYTIFVAPSGQTLYYVGTVLYINGSLSIKDMMQKATIAKVETDKLFRDIKAAKPLAKLPVMHTFKSASFGTSTYIRYEGQQTPDLSSPATARGQALQADIAQIATELHMKNTPRRPIGSLTPMLPGH